MKITFHGAAGGVTGSKHLIETQGRRILLDCGMFQGRRKEADELNKKFPFDAASIDAVILSHAHIDHSGLLPLLAKNGFVGRVYCTPATADILEPMLLDAAHIQEADAAYFLKNKRLRRSGIHPIEPLFTKVDAFEILHAVTKVPRHQKTEIFPGVVIEFWDAGHVLGSSQVLLESDGKKLAFTGDYGRKDRKIINDPETIPEADILITESTYGGRRHLPLEQNRDDLGNIIRETAARGGKVIIPSFALERSQEILYDLHLLYDEKKIPEIPVFVDSPLTTKFTKIFERNEKNFDEETKRYFLDKGKNPFSFERLRHTITTEESKKLNDFVGPCVIISASGMCEAGRIRHHLRNSISDPRNTILIVGYQAKDTLGRRLVEGHTMVKIFDEMHPVRAQVKILNGYSGHGDQKDLLDNVFGIQGLKKVFVVHGDPDQSKILADAITEKQPALSVTIPLPGNSFEL